jgi:glycine C-acetyltransferase
MHMDAPHASSFLDRMRGELSGIEAAGTWKNERVIGSAMDSKVTLASGAVALNFCANNYLGLSNHPNLVRAAKQALDTHGFGLSSVRFICGTQDIHKQLEREIASFHGMDDAILYPSCFDANAGLFEQILGPEDAVISDSLNHASIIDGIRLCKAQRHRYDHMVRDWTLSVCVCVCVYVTMPCHYTCNVIHRQLNIANHLSSFSPCLCH